MASLAHHLSHLLEDREIALLLGREEGVSFKERNDAFQNRGEVVNLEEPDSIRLVSNGAALQDLLETAPERLGLSVRR